MWGEKALRPVHVTHDAPVRPILRLAPPWFVRVTVGLTPLFKVRAREAGLAGEGGAGFRLNSHNANAKATRAIAATSHANTSRNVMPKRVLRTGASL